MPKGRFADWVVWLTALAAVLYGVALYIEAALVARPTGDISYGRTMVGCALMTYLSYRCAREVVGGRLFLFFNVVLSAALAIISLGHLGIVNH